MRVLSWMHRRFRHNNDEQSRNVSTGKSNSCFSTLWELDEQQHYPETNNNRVHFRQPRAFPESATALQAFGLEELNEEETAEMNPEFFHRFLAIGTLGHVSITEEAITPKDAKPFEILTEEENAARENELQCLDKTLEKLTEKEAHDVRNKLSNGMDTKENNNMVVCPVKEYTEIAATTEESMEQKTTPNNPFKKKETSYKKLNFMNKMLKKLDFTSLCIPTSAGAANATFCDSTRKKSTKVLQKSRKIHPEATEVHVIKSNSYEVKKMCINEHCDTDVMSDDEDNTHPQAQILKKDALDSQTAGKKARWIKTDADYFVLEF